jgi:rubrerythrin
MLTKTELISKIEEEYGDTMELVQSAAYDGECVGICRECGTTVDNIEPDSTNGYCENCESNNVISILILYRIL